MKIANLPKLAAANIDGTETLPVVKGASSWQAALSDLAQPMVTAAQTAANVAEALAGPTYATVAAGLTATTSGQCFAVQNADKTVSAYLNSLGVAVLQRAVATTTALAATTGGALVGANDGANGSLFTTVQGFLARLLSSAGAALVGWTNGQSGGATRTLAAKLGEVSVSIVDFGAVADSTSYTSGTDNGPAIQRAIRYVSQCGGGTVLVPPAAQPYANQPLESRVAYGWKGLLCIPSNVRLVGGGPNGSVLRRIDTGNSIGITVGTFGPSNTTNANMASCIKYAIADVTASAGPLTNAVTLVTAANAANFTVGDVVCVEGAASTFGVAGQYLPNMAARVTGVNTSTGVITLDHALDDGDGNGYVTTGGVAPGIRRLRNDTATWFIDCTGGTWPLAVATKAGMEGLGIDTPNATGWATPNLSVYDCRFRDLEINAFYVAGNPVSFSLFEDVFLKYYGSVTEVAYLSHDTLFRRCTFTRHANGVGNVQGVPLLWINQGEGAKRIHFERIVLTDRADVAGSVTVQALALRIGSTLIDSKITIPKGNLGYTQGACEIRNSVLNCNAAGTGTSAGLVLYSDALLNTKVRAPGATQAVLAQGICRIEGNTVGDFSNAPTTLASTDIIALGTGATGSAIKSNLTARSLGNPTIATVTYSGTLTATSSVTSGDLLKNTNLARIIGLDFRVTAAGFLSCTGTGLFKLSFNAYDSSGTAYVLATLSVTTSMAGIAGKFSLEYQHHEPGSQSASYELALWVGTTRYASIANSGGALVGSSIVGFGLSVSGLTSGDTLTIQSALLTYEPLGSTL